MQNSSTPWMAGSIFALAAFVVWLSAQMSRTDRADRIVETLAVCGVLIALAFALGTVGARRRG